ncbi:transmembrane and immunoglobulin domain-containing protein 1 isoform X2 [Rhineura floridana]|uniref:transmembrane and immunoglobulin domain-containing protein 1 isoform X1 n=1 Tax=Rhineura floridana TaxID=261503 RepID=UPI002AC88D46|nr:transmembrane and immunoglobulin domain-containing protein 1 isoform X1 [Rhineura floridana]XP_061461327.1 transmembrane and immunoglobulin domain-containing protein 1 isoform X1 [Rhineura floridana]XP_061461328.1 transmembrane and immunoglobulin domain-containing protein 1 isoform X1 [Rhineura floridana]XP_061461329.1 transmembrane and immunoglobulin domain-containing protein 1 isoform X1 [Rhineura floridana]XP_061461330.1 transmembrane and immunoglobulin domain-containing protein 1 isoform
MASKGTAGVLWRTPLFLLALLPCTVTGIQLAINANTTGYQLPTRPGLQESLWCTVQNHSQGEELLWFRGDGQVDLKDGNKVNASNICISITTDDNGVSFTCKLARDGSVKISVVLEVLFSPVLSGEDPPSAEEASDVTLNCHTKANPPAQMVWYKDNRTLALEKSRYQVYQTSDLFQLAISRAQTSDGGVYTCLAVSDWGTERRDFHLVVKDRKLPFPTEAVIAAAVVVFLTILFAIVARWKRIAKCFGKASEAPSNTSL